jgi:selenocysteine-specific elongation factor
MSIAAPVATSKQILIGTAGHIDHGKTRLVGRLTGINTDRLPEEQARGISIDLGFAHFESDGIQFGVVDVPGHERFVKNMVSGATGVNLALLVIAADDSVMPQTREHLEIMQLLGIPTGLVALTKIDLVEPDFVELVSADIEDFLRGTFLEGCPIIPVSSLTGEGLDELRAALVACANRVELPESLGLFRMPIDRVFSVAGHGTVVTGSVMSGCIEAGDTLELAPQMREVRVRGVQHHGQQAASAAARQRTAINLAGVKAEEITRGMELASPGYLCPTRRLLVELRNLASSPLVLRDRLVFNLHLGTCETLARINLKGQTLAPGQIGFAELRTKEPIVATHGQRFILRRISPNITLAGGRVLDPCLPVGKRIKDLQSLGEKWSSSSDTVRLSALTAQKDSIDDSPLEAVRRAGLRPESYRQRIEELLQARQLVRLGGERGPLVHKDRLAALSASVMKTIREVLAKHQPRRALPRELFLSACREITQLPLLEAVFQQLQTKGELVKVGSQIGPADAQVKLTKNQQATRAKLLEEITAAGLTPPTTKELAAAVGQPLEQVMPLLHVSCEEGLLVRVADDLYFAPEAIDHARQVCSQTLSAQGAATVAQLRDAWGVSRKYSIPLCEFFDERGWTVRQGDLRVAGPNLVQTSRS